MTTELRERLGGLAAAATADLELRHPELPASTVPSDSPGRRPALMLVAAAAMALIVGGWWLSRPSTSVIDVAGDPKSQPVPALLLEEPTPLAELSPQAQEALADASLIPPLERLYPEASAIEFPGAHVVEQNDVTVVVALDTTGRVLCTATYVMGEDASTSSCGSPTSLMTDLAIVGQQSVSGRTVTTVLVSDDAVAVQVGDDEVPVVRNIAILDKAVNDVLVLRYADGTTRPAQSIPNPDAEGTVALAGERSIEVGSVGCSIVDGELLVKVAAFDDGSLISAVLAPNGVFLTGGIDGKGIEETVLEAIVESKTVDDTLTVTATWADANGTSTITTDCGDRLLNLDEIR